MSGSNRAALKDLLEGGGDTAAPVLLSAFKRFNEASERLEARYAALLKESEILRSQLQEKDREVKRAEKLSLLGETAAALAHEVRNPLGAMKLFLSLLEKEVAGNSSAQELVAHIDGNITSLDNLVENILHFSRGRPQAVALLNLHAILNESICETQRVKAPKIEVEAILDGDPYLAGNAQGLKQVFVNLLLNAFQAVKRGGRVCVRTRNDEQGRLEIVVHDNGPGIPQEIIERIFEPFVTTKNEGTGLGLAIVKQIVDLHHGTVTAQNCAGAKFSVVLPRSCS